ncbi:MAG: hypothetical protein JWO52_6410 [Gammaproteobacteria bacterium]|nr:hypothetical protein [Gammaproteobacteria bacterium]
MSSCVGRLRTRCGRRNGQGFARARYERCERARSQGYRLLSHRGVPWASRNSKRLTRAEARARCGPCTVAVGCGRRRTCGPFRRASKLRSPKPMPSCACLSEPRDSVSRTEAVFKADRAAVAHRCAAPDGAGHRTIQPRRNCLVALANPLLRFIGIDAVSLNSEGAGFRGKNVGQGEKVSEPSRPWRGRRQLHRGGTRRPLVTSLRRSKRIANL